MTIRSGVGELIDYLGTSLIAMWLPGRAVFGAIGEPYRRPRVELNGATMTNEFGFDAAYVADGADPPMIVPGVTPTAGTITIGMIYSPHPGCWDVNRDFLGNNDGAGANYSYMLSRNANDREFRWADITHTWNQANLTQDTIHHVQPAEVLRPCGVVCSLSGATCALKQGHFPVVTAASSGTPINFRETYFGGSGPGGGAAMAILMAFMASTEVLTDQAFQDIWARVLARFHVVGPGWSDVLI